MKNNGKGIGKRRYVVYIPGMPITSDVIKNRSLGGSESSGFYLAKELVKQGNDVAIFSDVQQGEEYEGVTILPIGQRSEQYKLGEGFEKSCCTSQFDVLISQRLPNAFYRSFNNKVNLYWLHDLSIVRTRDGIRSTLWNCDGVFTVSEFHKKQVMENVGLPDHYVHVLRNAVSGHFVQTIEPKQKWEGKNIVYTSRPERGLKNALDIMDKLEDKSITLHVCGYDNTTPQMAAHYNELWQRCMDMSNVELHGPLNKQQLANLFNSAFLHLYPVISPNEFEEVSCISVMEAQMTGTPVLASMNGALEETLEFGGSILLDYEEDKVNTKLFAFFVNKLANDYDYWNSFAANCRNDYTYERSAQVVDNLVSGILSKSTPLALANHFLHNSDYFAAKALEIKHPDLDKYSFVEKNKFAELYEEINEYCKNDNNTHNIGNDQAVLGLPRFAQILPFIEKMSREKSAKVLDYGCCIGQLDISLARKFPNLTIYGVDLSEGNIEQANEFKKKFEIDNVHYSTEIPSVDFDFDLIICSEVMEHVTSPWELTDELESYLSPNGRMIITVPFGAVESNRYGNFPHREHIHHFEHDDISDIWGQKKELQIQNFSYGEVDKLGKPVGGTVVTYINDVKHGKVKTGQIDYNHKLLNQNPKQTLSVCIIVKEDEIDKGLRKTLDSVKDIADEIIIGIDIKGEGVVTESLVVDYNATCFALTQSPLVQGFDAARNETIERATCDWIFWIDADEVLRYPEKVTKYLCNSPFQGYSVKQNHFSSEPLSILKVDLPLRLFRRSEGFKFFGMVHEHPSISPTEAPKFAMICNDFWIDHGSYATEEIRRKRFERNIDLMKADREKYPDRTLGKMLWIRDQMHLAQFEYERHGMVSEQTKERAEDALNIFRELINDKEIRFAVESIMYVNMAATILVGVENVINTTVSIASQKSGIGTVEAQPINVMFVNTEDAKNFCNMIVEENFKIYDEKYF